MIGLVAIDGAVRPLATELHAAWPESSRVHVASIGNCFQAPDAMSFALGRYRRVVAFAPLPTVVSLLRHWHIEAPRGTSLLCVDPQRRWVIPLAGGEAAEELAREVQLVLGVTPVLTDYPSPPGDPAITPSPPFVPGTPADAPVLRVVDWEEPGESDVLVYPRTLVVGIGAGSGTEPAELMRLLTDTLAEEGLDRSSVARLATVTGKADHPAVRWAASRLTGVPVDEHPVARLADVPVPNPSDLVGTAVGTASVAEAAALASAPGGRLVVTKRKSATATVAIARAAVPGRLVVIDLGPDGPDRLGPQALTELRGASAVVGRPNTVEALADLLRPGTRQVAVAAPGTVRSASGRVVPWAYAAQDGTGTAVDHIGAATELAAHGHTVALVTHGDDAEPAVPPGRYDVHHVPQPTAVPARPAGDPA
ncbi:cobalamin biosynthesis protein [Kitasatospora sp. NPDC053057]|uniref:cobalamin biosynthesis protein n=1 Tax=Kitasatospora sp. NPDC053057 TaxID=3364062 RepID=UPI0037C68B45